MIRILIVEDSPTVRILLKNVLESDPELKVIGSARNGLQAIKQSKLLKPDLITMDIRMPVMDGFEATRRIMAECPTPIVVVSIDIDDPTLQIAFNAIKVGALDVVEKPAGLLHKDFEKISQRLISSVKLMSQVKVVRQRFSFGSKRPLSKPMNSPRRQIVAVGASTGGPAALNTFLKSLPATFPLPIVIVQHMSAGFLKGLINWLQSECALSIVTASQGQRIQPSTVYFAPDGCHLELRRRQILTFNYNPPVNYVRPSVNVLFESVAQSYRAATIGILLTGMGKDGAIGLKKIHDHGGLTIVQDQSSSVVYGMPKAAVELAAVDYILPIDQIGPRLKQLVHKNRE
jgi:two-component system chemotaxis response regulator CheB